MINLDNMNRTDLELLKCEVDKRLAEPGSFVALVAQPMQVMSDQPLTVQLPNGDTLTGAYVQFDEDRDPFVLDFRDRRWYLSEDFSVENFAIFILDHDGMLRFAGEPDGSDL